MKQNIYLWFLSVLIMPCVLANPFQLQNVKEFTLNGAINGLKDGVRLYLIQDSSKDTVAIAISKNGKFIMSGVVPNGTEYYYLRLDTLLAKKRSTEFLLINANLTLVGALSNWPEVQLIGSEPDEEYRSLVNLWSSIEERDLKKERLKQFVAEHANSLYISDFIRRAASVFTIDERQSLFDKLTARAKQSYFGNLLDRELRDLKLRQNIKRGSLLPNFQVATPEGSYVKVIDLIGKSHFTLIDFWASWCKPCRSAIPKLKRIYRDHSKNGLNILSIAISDEEEDWKRALSQDATPWANVRDAAGVCNKIFDIPAIPGYILVNGKGELIAFDCPGSTIKQFGPPLQIDTLYSIIEGLLNISDTFRNNSPDTIVAPIRDNKAESRSSTENEVFKALQIGQKVPNISLGEMTDKLNVEVKMSDYRGKLLILDFWSTWCSFCISQFPKIEMLQKDYGEKVVILPVGFDGNKLGSIREYLKKTRGTSRSLNIPNVVQGPSDTVLMKLFPFSGMPFLVWIDPNGTLIGLTDHRALTSKNIDKILLGQKPNFSIKKVFERSLGSGPFLINTAVANINNYGSSFAGYIDTLSCISSGRITVSGDKFRYYGVNRPIYAYYADVYCHLIPELTSIWGKKRIVVETSTDSFYKDFHDTKSMDDWEYQNFAKNNLFTYEAILPANYGIDDIRSHLISDFDRYFKIESKVINRLTKYIALIKLSTFRGANGPLDAICSMSTDSLNISGLKIEMLVDQLNSILDDPKQIIDESDGEGIVDIRLDIRDANLDSIRKQLRNYGLDLLVKEKQLPMLILKSQSVGRRF